AWTPGNWRREFVNLNTIAGQDDVRLAFVVLNGQGNNIFLDNIEIFNSDDSTPLNIAEQFAIYPGDNSGDDFRVTFNLEERKNVAISVYDMSGRVMFSREESNVLNQTYGISLAGKPSGIFIVHIRGQNFFKAKKIYIRR
ncbi:MAG TPA: T9SS type A sorting domain-containing protein, partial [Cyclobacteriaceae bacterium]|nr:T9SS type A sorting domain-containing protein [Cyclobacteriaceae bacterium]